MKSNSDIDESIIESYSSFDESKEKLKSSKQMQESTLKTSMGKSNINNPGMAQSIRTEMDNNRNSHQPKFTDTIQTSYNREVLTHDKFKSKHDSHDKIVSEEINDCLFYYSRSLNIYTEKNFQTDTKQNTQIRSKSPRSKSPRSLRQSRYRNNIDQSPKTSHSELDFESRYIVQDAYYKVLTTIYNNEVDDRHHKINKHGIDIHTQMGDYFQYVKPMVDTYYEDKVNATVKDIDSMFEAKDLQLTTEFLEKTAIDNYCTMSAYRILKNNKIDYRQNYENAVRECYAVANELKHKSKLARIGKYVDL